MNKALLVAGLATRVYRTRQLTEAAKRKKPYINHFGHVVGRGRGVLIPAFFLKLVAWMKKAQLVAGPFEWHEPRVFQHNLQSRTSSGRRRIRLFMAATWSENVTSPGELTNCMSPGLLSSFLQCGHDSPHCKDTL